MENSKQLQVSTNALQKISETYIKDISVIQEYYPKHIKEKIDNLTKDQKKEVINFGRRMASGIKSSIPMRCKGKKCCLGRICALLKNGIAPENCQCPYEEFMVDKLTAEYYSSLQVDPFNRVERDLVKQLVELIIIDNRASSDIGNDGLYSVQNVGVDNKGRAITNITESLAFNIKMRTQVRIEKIQNELLATRKIRKQFEVGQNDDPSSKASDLYERFKNFTEKNEIITDVEIIDEHKNDSKK